MGGVDTAPEMERMTDMRVYADQAATTSLSKTALEAMLPWMTENFGNPSALYEEGRTARDAVETAREKIAHLLHAKAKEIYFTSGFAPSTFAICSLPLVMASLLFPAIA